MNLTQITQKPGSRSLLVGATGTGKTTLARHLLRNIPVQSLICLDPKCTFEFDGAPIVDTPKQLEVLSKKNDVVIFRPQFGDSGIEAYSQILHWIYTRGNTLLYIDELYGLSENGYTFPPELSSLYTRGRERGITIMGASQRPVKIPVVCRSEVEFYYVFNLKHVDDRKLMAQDTGEPIIENKTDEHVFWYFAYNDKIPPVQYKLRGNK